MLQWCKVEGYKLLREVDLRIVQSFRASWKDGALAKKKKQELATGFFGHTVQRSPSGFFAALRMTHLYVEYSTCTFTGRTILYVVSRACRTD